MIGIKTWLYNLSKTKIYIPKTLTSEVYDSVGGTSLDQIIEKNNNNISDAYSDQKTYAVGDYCIYNTSLYKCITEITTAESFDSAKWEPTSIDKLLGNNDISSIGDGTVTGGISTLNDNLTNNYLPLSGGTMDGTISGSAGGKLTTDGNVYLKTDGFDGWLSSYLFNLTSKLGTSQDWYNATIVAATGVCSACVVNNIAYVTMEITPTQITHGTNLVSNLPCPRKQYYTTLPGIGGSNYPVIIGTDGKIWVYYPHSTTLERIDYAFSYPL